MSQIKTYPLLFAEGIKIRTKHDTVHYKPDDVEVEGSHVHGLWELYINLSGDVSFFHEKDLFSITCGDIVLSAPGEFHHCIYNSSRPHEHFCLWVDASCEPELFKYINSAGRRGRIRLSSTLVPHLVSLATELNSVSGAERTALFFELLHLSVSGEISDSEVESSLPHELQKIVDYINTDFAKISRINDIAEKFHVSSPTLNRWFRERLDISPKRLLVSKKMAYAEKLLVSGVSVTDACYLSGFSDLSRFVGAFRRIYGDTPLKYRKKKLNDSFK